ncbi:hypothetical protein SK128_015453 [Halocaridina rubra]|uniref:Uncharacterized protein n=1 Tax=Halocaridina rubra TaxID=373956 RepID=A0AAN8ZTU7_HALRR
MKLYFPWKSLCGLFLVLAETQEESGNCTYLSVSLVHSRGFQDTPDSRISRTFSDGLPDERAFKSQDVLPENSHMTLSAPVESRRSLVGLESSQAAIPNAVISKGFQDIVSNTTQVTLLDPKETTGFQHIRPDRRESTGTWDLLQNVSEIRGSQDLSPSLRDSRNSPVMQPDDSRDERFIFALYSTTSSTRLTTTTVTAISTCLSVIRGPFCSGRKRPDIYRSLLQVSVFVKMKHSLWICLVTLSFLLFDYAECDSLDVSALSPAERKENLEESDDSRDERIFAFYTSTSLTRLVTTTITAVSTCLSITTGVGAPACTGRRRRISLDNLMKLEEPDTDMTNLDASEESIEDISRQGQATTRGRMERKLTVWSTNFTTLTVTSTSALSGTTVTASLLCVIPGAVNSCFLG